MVFLKPVNEKENKDGISAAMKTDIAHRLHWSWVTKQVRFDYSLDELFSFSEIEVLPIRDLAPRKGRCRVA